MPEFRVKFLLLVFQHSPVAHQLEPAELNSNMTESQLQGVGDLSTSLSYDFFTKGKKRNLRYFQLDRYDVDDS